MECKCGGTTYERSHTKTVKGEIIARLTYDRCITCGNSGNFLLYEKGECTAGLDEAIKLFEEKYG